MSRRGRREICVCRMWPGVVRRVSLQKREITSLPDDMNPCSDGR